MQTGIQRNGTVPVGFPGQGPRSGAASAVVQASADKLMSAIEELAAEIASSAKEGGAGESLQCPEVRAAQVAQMLLLQRRRRIKLFGEDLFADPVWDLLLDLYAAHAQGRDVSVGSACIAAAVPLTSALRWCRLLELRGMICRERDPKDGRRVFVRLTRDTKAQMTALLAETSRAL